VGQRKAIVAAMDRTEPEAGDQTTLALNRVADQAGRHLKARRNYGEALRLARLTRAPSPGVAVKIRVDRGCGDPVTQEPGKGLLWYRRLSDRGAIR